MLFSTFKRDWSVAVFVLFALVGGFLEAFTFLLHNGVFCNAQTGNIVMAVIRLTQGDYPSMARYLCSIAAYLAGILLSTAFPRYFKRISWPAAVCGLEIAVLILLVK